MCRCVGVFFCSMAYVSARAHWGNPSLESAYIIIRHNQHLPLNLLVIIEHTRLTRALESLPSLRSQLGRERKEGKAPLERETQNEIVCLSLFAFTDNYTVNPPRRGNAGGTSGLRMLLARFRCPHSASLSYSFVSFCIPRPASSSCILIITTTALFFTQ